MTKTTQTNPFAIKNFGDAVACIIGTLAIGGIALPGIAQGIDAHFNHVNIAMGEGTEQVQIGTYNCSNRTFNPKGENSGKWVDEREFSAGMNGGWMGDLLTNGLFNRFDEICDER